MSDIIDDDVMDNVLAQLNEDSAYITEALREYGEKRANAVESQKLAIATYYAEIAEIEREYNGDTDDQEHIGASEPVVDHNVLRYLKIDKGSEQAKKIETFAPKKPHELTETMLKNIEELQFIASAGVTHPPPSEAQKSKIRERMFDFLDESRMEETRLELEYDKAVEENNKKEMEEISDALYYLQRLHADQLNDMISEYRPNGQPNQWGNDPDYMAMLNNLKRVGETTNKLNGSSRKNISGGGGGAGKRASKKKKNIEAAKKASAAVGEDSADEVEHGQVPSDVIIDEVEVKSAAASVAEDHSVVAASIAEEVHAAADSEAVEAVVVADDDDDGYGDGDDFEDDFEEL